MDLLPYLRAFGLEEAHERNVADHDVPKGILPPNEKSRRNVPDLSSQNSEDKTAKSPLVQGPVTQS